MAFGIRPARLAPGRGLAAVALSVALIAGVPSAAPAATVHVPSEQPTIQAGISAVSDGDTVYVAPDTYTGSGNRDIDFGGMNVSLMSTGGAAVTVINCEGDGRAFYFHTGEDTTSLIEGFTIREGTGDYGGAVRCQGTSPVFRSCIFFLNDATAGGGALHANSTSGPRLENCTLHYNTAQSGGAVYMDGSAGWARNCTFRSNSVTHRGGAAYLRLMAETSFEDCTFSRNTAGFEGGGVYSVDAESAFEQCIFVGNEGASGGGVYAQTDYNPLEFMRCTFVDNNGGGICCKDAYPIVTQSILALDRTQAGILCAGFGLPEITHCYVFGNAGGDSLCGTHVENRFEDPLLCGHDTGDVRLCANSPCLPGASPWGVHVGAAAAGCPDCDSPIDFTSWGLLKARYR